MLVISHDDRYFHLGDRLLKLEEGQLIKSEQAEAVAAAQPQQGINLCSAAPQASS